MKHTRVILILAVCLTALSFSSCVLLDIWCTYRKGNQDYKELQKYVIKEIETEEIDTGEVIEHENVQVDFPSLKELNADIVGWIKCEELGLDYPVVQGNDNEYYLNHTFLGEEHISGCIFMDAANLADLTDDNTILYGSNMKDGSMFGSFSQTDTDGLEVLFLTMDGNHVYKLMDDRKVAADDDIYFRTAYSREDFEALCSAIAEETGNQPVWGEHLLTLCTNNTKNDGRHLLIFAEINQ